MKDQYRLTAHLQQKLTSLEDELAAAHRLSQSSQLEMGCAEDSQLAEAEAEALELRVQLQSELKERDEAISAATRQMEMCEALNKELDQAVADLQIDLAACKQKEEGHDATVESLQQEVRSKDEAVQEWKAHAQQWQVRASQLETELDAQVRTLGDSVRQVTDSAAQIANLERELRSSKESAERSQVALASLQQQVLELEAEAGSRNAERELQDLATAELHSRAASLEEELCAEQDRCQALACRVETTGNELSQTREDLATAKAESVEDRAQLANAADHGDRLREEHLALQKAVEHQHGLEADAHAEATSLKVALEAATEKNMLLETTTQIMQQEVDALEAETASARARAGEDQLHITKLQHALETLEEEVVTGKKLQEAQLGTHADLHRAMVQTEDQLARALRSDEMQQELTAKLRTSLGASEVSLSQYRASLEAAEAMESQLRKQLDTLRTESKEQKKTATDLNIKLAQSEEERNASDTAFETLRSIEGDLRGQLAQEAEQLSEVRSALQVQQHPGSNVFCSACVLLRIPRSYHSTGGRSVDMQLCFHCRYFGTFRRSVNGQLEQSLTATVSELSQTRAEASAQESVAQQLEQKLVPRLLESVPVATSQRWEAEAATRYGFSLALRPHRKRSFNGMRTVSAPWRSKLPWSRPRWPLPCRLQSSKLPQPQSCSRVARLWPHCRRFAVLCNCDASVCQCFCGILAPKQPRTTFRPRCAVSSPSSTLRCRLASSSSKANLSSRTIEGNAQSLESIVLSHCSGHELTLKLLRHAGKPTSYAGAGWTTAC